MLTNTMIFADLYFLYLFFPLCMLFYLVFQGISKKNAVLTIASLLFYAWGEPRCVFLLIFSTAFSYAVGLLIDVCKNSKFSKIWLISGLVVNLGILFLFKYTGFLMENINAIFNTDFSTKTFKLPIGISFYTFQIISYLIDCYWGKTKPQQSYPKFLMYVSLFPQLVAGPIVRYSTIAAEIDNRKVTAEDWREGLSRIIFGLSKKVIIANSLSTVVGEVFGGDIKTVSVVGTWYGATLFALQVYFDFSGYSDMAIGLGRLFGFHFNENFNYPFIAKDIQEFWQRWHISLGSFFRDYLLYIPIFGKRRKYGGLFLVWFCTGLWHGASWNFVFWGLYFGLFILIETLVGKKKIKKLPVYVRHLYTKIVLIIGFGIFYFEDTKRLGNFFKNLIGLNHNSFSDHVISVSFANNIWLISLAILLSMPVWKNIKTRLNNYNSKSNNIPALYALNIAETTFLVLLLFTSSVLLVGATNNAFLYYRF